MTIQTEMAIVPFQGIIKPVRGVDYRILKYSEGENYNHNEPSSLSYDTGQTGTIYDKSGKESTSGYSLGKNIDIYI